MTCQALLAKTLKHVHNVSTCSENKATGEGKESRHMCFETDLFLPHIFCLNYQPSGAFGS